MEQLDLEKCQKWDYNISLTGQCEKQILTPSTGILLSDKEF
jgi:hypothetical protein